VTRSEAEAELQAQPRVHDKQRHDAGAEEGVLRASKRGLLQSDALR